MVTVIVSQAVFCLQTNGILFLLLDLLSGFLKVQVPNNLAIFAPPHPFWCQNQDFTQLSGCNTKCLHILL